MKITHLADLTPTVKGSQRRADGTPGLRFGFAYDNTLDKSGYDENSVSYGAVVIPAAFAESLNITLNTENVADVPAVNLYDTTDESEYIYTAVVKNIPDGTGDDGYDAANTDIIAAPYVKYAIDGTRYVVYGNSIVRNWIAANYGFGSLGYAPYKYVYVITKVNNTIVVDQEGRIETVYNINKADDTTAFDQESGTTETVYKLNVCMNGKVTTIPTAIDYGSGVNWASYQMQLATVTDIKDGKYVLKPCAHMKDAYDTTSQEGHEINVAGGRLTYDGYTKTYEITYNGKTYTTLLDADSEFYVQTNKDGIYDSIKCYTMDNPYTSLGNVWLSDGIIKVNYGSNGKPVSYTLVVAYTCTSS